VNFLRLTVLLVLVPALALLTPLALASPPDPAWIQGIYDDGDFDNIVVLVTWTAAAIDLFSLDDSSCDPPVSTALHRTHERAVSSDTPSLIHPRAPPAF
jgi:hypothetical protein